MLTIPPSHNREYLAIKSMKKYDLNRFIYNPSLIVEAKTPISNPCKRWIPPNTILILLFAPHVLHRGSVTDVRRAEGKVQRIAIRVD